MSNTTQNTAQAWTPEDVLSLVVQPLERESLATRLSQFQTGLTGDALRVPLVTDDPSAQWVNEGEEIPLSDASLGETDARYRKLAGLTVVSRELAEDSHPSAVEEIGKGLVRDIARKLDAAMFSDAGAKAPSGLATLDGVTELTAPAKWANLDVFKQAKLRAAALGTSVAAFVVNTEDAAALLVLKETSASNKDLIESDGTSFTIGGTPVLPSEDVAAGTAWAVPAGRIVVGVRQNTSVDVDHSAFFTSDRVAIRATMRVAFAFTHPKAVTKIVQASA
ncbi:phage major capsid protein [Kocuria marina]|uniref:phage major capsid protein n=1 Tax=Kocuria marina TaxID=223184 RepID=UPI0022E13408|nr:phage major capsid protein [Kocuria marina]